MTDSALERSWAVARDVLEGSAASSRDVLAGLPAGLQHLLVDGAGTPEAAADHLLAHTAEALVAERLVLRAGGQGMAALLGKGDPADLLLKRSGARRSGGRVDAVLPRAVSPRFVLDAWPQSFSPRAQKRRGGVYTDPDLVDLVLDLAGWDGRGRLLEPAAGAGVFLWRAWERAVASGAPDLGGRVVGVDRHPFACRAARTTLAMAAARRGVGPEAVPKVERADALSGPRGAPTERAGAWSLVVGNPPWVRGERVPADLRAAYRRRYADVGPGNIDLCAYFVRRALEWLEPGGRLAFVLPQGLFEARSAAGLRDLLAARTVEALVTLEWAPARFADATVIPCVLVVRAEPPAKTHGVALGRAAGAELSVGWTRLRQSSWLEVSRGPWPLQLQRGDLGVLRRLGRAPTPLEAGYGLAVRTKAAAGDLICSGPPPEHFTRARPLIDGREVRAWNIDYAGRWIDYRTDVISDPKSEAFFAAPKVVVPRIALTPQAAVDDGDPALLARNTVMVVRAPGTPLDADPHALAAVINSLPVRAYAFHVLRAGVLAGSHRATFYANMLGQLPVPEALLSDRGLVRRLGRLARRARALVRAGRTEALAAVEAQVDAAVASAFGLSEAELSGLRARAAREPLRTVLRPIQSGAPTRNIAVAEYAAGERYR